MKMIDRKLSVSVSMACATAWTAWVAMASLLAVAAVKDEMVWAMIGVAAAAIAATLQIRCFLIQMDQHLSSAYELGRESERTPRLRSTL